MSREEGRRAARRRAVILLYQHDVTGLPLEDLVQNAERSGETVGDFARALMEGASLDREYLDGVIDEAAEGWTADRMAPLERNILRVGVHELLDHPETPEAVVIAEAVATAQRFCGPDAHRLINGILGRVAREREETTT